MSTASTPLEAWHAAEARFERDPETAATLYASLTSDAAFGVAAHLRLSLLAERRSALREATAHAIAACSAGTSQPDALGMLAKRLFSVGEVEASIACARHPAVTASGDARLQAELGKLMTDAFEPVLASKLLGRAWALGLRTPAVAYLRGLSALYCGELIAAREHLLGVLRVAPDDARAQWVLSKLPTDADDTAPDRIRRARMSLSRLGDGHRDAPLLHYALFKALDSCGDTTSAWSALEAGMRTRRAQIRYSPDADRALFERLRRTHLRPTEAHDIDGPAPVFIVGMPRTGTTLLERLLGSHPAVQDAGELHDFVLQLRWSCDLYGPPYLDGELAAAAEYTNLTEVGRRYLMKTRARAGTGAWFTDKMPANHVNVGYILSALPGARILHMRRSAMDTCFSNLKELFAGAYPYSYDLRETAAYYVGYRALMAHWAELAPDRILDVDYERLVAEPDAVAREVARFLDLESAPQSAHVASRAEPVTTASAVQVREGVHGRHVDQWTRYAAPLEPLRAALAAAGAL